MISNIILMSLGTKFETMKISYDSIIGLYETEWKSEISKLLILNYYYYYYWITRTFIENISLLLSENRSNNNTINSYQGFRFWWVFFNLVVYNLLLLLYPQYCTIRICVRKNDPRQCNYKRNIKADSLSIPKTKWASTYLDFQYQGLK